MPRISIAALIMKANIKNNIIVSSKANASVAAWAVAAYFLTFSVDSSVDVSLLVLMAGAVWMQFDGKSRQVKFNSIDALVIGFVIVLLVCALLSESIQKSFILSAAFVPALLLYYLIRHCRGDSDFNVVLSSLLIQVIGLAVLLVYKATTEDLLPADLVKQIGSSILIVPNDVVFLVLANPLFLALHETSRNRAISAAVGISIILIAVAVISLQSRLALLTGGLSISCYYLSRSRRISAMSVLSVIAVIVLIDSIFEFALIQKIISFSDSRLPLWYSAWEMFKEKPFLGFGPHTFGEFYQAYFVYAGFAENIVVDNRHTPWPHNLYLELLAEYGLLGFTAFFAIVAVVVRQLLRRVPKKDDDWLAVNSGLLAAFTGFLFAAFFELTLLRLWVVVFMFALLGFSALMLEQGMPAKVKENSIRKPLKTKNRSRTVSSV